MIRLNWQERRCGSLCLTWRALTLESERFSKNEYIPHCRTKEIKKLNKKILNM